MFGSLNCSLTSADGDEIELIVGKSGRLALCAAGGCLYCDIGKWTQAGCLELGHALLWVDGSDLDHEIQPGWKMELRREKLLEQDKAGPLLDITIVGQTTLSFGPFPLDQIQKMGGFFVEYGSQGEAMRDTPYLDPFSRRLMEELEKRKKDRGE